MPLDHIVTIRHLIDLYVIHSHRYIDVALVTNPYQSQLRHAIKEREKSIQNVKCMKSFINFGVGIFLKVH